MWAWIVGIAVWAYQDYAVPTTTMVGSHIIGTDVVHPRVPGENTIKVGYTIHRYRACTLDVSRLIRRVDQGSIFGDQEFQVQHVVQNFKASKHDHPSSYEAVVDRGTPPGKYVAFSRGRYLCNLLDDMVPRFIVTDEVPFTIE